jgi:hypothetical protein
MRSGVSTVDPLVSWVGNRRHQGLYSPRQRIRKAFLIAGGEYVKYGRHFADWAFLPRKVQSGTAISTQTWPTARPVTSTKAQVSKIGGLPGLVGCGIIHSVTEM